MKIKVGIVLLGMVMPQVVMAIPNEVKSLENNQLVVNSDNKIEAVRRIALFAASNHGGDGRQALRYAESDALSLSKVFEELGGLSPVDNTILLSPTKDRFLNTLNVLKSRVEQDKNTRTEFIFYYSGHSDAEGLLLGDGKVGYRELRNAINDIQSDVKIAILDSCQSGVFTRLKGGKRISPFLMNAANRVNGNVFLSASSESEAAQESDEIEGSFFTHHFVSALRGASDISNDKQVTLNEAYQYAFNHTLENTENSQAGAQHPAYNFQIAGAGDLVLTDIKMASSTLLIPDSIIGRIYVRDIRGGLVVELNKVLFKPLTIALEPGMYTVVVETSPSLFQSTVELKKGQIAKLESNKFSKLKMVENRSRGNSSAVHFNKPYLKRYSVGVGYVNASLNLQSDGFYYPYIQSSNTFPDKGKSYTGYEFSIASSWSRNSDFTMSYFKTTGWGTYEGITVGTKRKFFEKKKSKIEYAHLYTGIGFFMERIRGFPQELESYYGWNVWRLSTSEEWGVQIPMGIKMAKNHYFVSAEVRAKFGKEQNGAYKHNSRLNNFLFSIGYDI